MYNNIETHIIETARQTFIELGFKNTSMSEIAARAEINRSTLHYYFRTKDIMFQSVFSSIVEPILPHLMNVIEEENSLMNKIEIILDAYIDLFSLTPELPHFVAEEIHRDSKHMIETFESLHFDKYVKALETLFLKEMEAKNIKNVEISHVFLTFYSQLIFPFLSKNFIEELFFDNKKDFPCFIQAWKTHILHQMRCLLYD